MFSHHRRDFPLLSLDYVNPPFFVFFYLSEMIWGRLIGVSVWGAALIDPGK